VVRTSHLFVPCAVMSIFAVVLSLPAGAAAQARPDDSPAEWLSAAGKSAGWTKATANCRELLGKLKLDDPVVKAALPRLKARCLTMRKVGQPKGWYEAVPFSFLEAMLEDLAKGVEPAKRYAGKGVGFPYWSEKTNRMESIWVHVPPGFEPGRKYQMFLYYKCGGGIHYKDGKAAGGYRPTVAVANQTDTFHVWSSLSTQVKGRMGAVHELAQSVPALARDFSVDPDRVFLTGWSDGGFTAIWLASRHPHLVAGIAPNCANWQYSNVNQVGLFNVPMLAVDGWTDGGYNRGQFVRWHTLHTMGYEVAGLWGHHGHSYQPYEDVTEFKQILDWAKTKRRDLWPKRVRYATWNLCWHRAYWLSIERMGQPWLAAQVDAEVKDGNRIEVKAWNVAAYKLSLSGKLLDAEKPVTVITNGRQSYSGPFKKELAIELVEPGAGKFLKSAAAPGGISTQIDRSTYGMRRDGGLKIADRRWMWVRPTGGEEKTRKLLSGWSPNRAKDDAEVTESDLAGHNLFVFGGPEINKLTARIAGELPVKFARGSFTIGRKVYDAPTNCVKFIHPNPLNPKKYVIVYAFNDAASFARNGFFGTKSESAWTFRSGDCVVMGVPGEERKWGVAVSAPAFETDRHIFDGNWRPAGAEPVGKLETAFDYTQILRLRADAAREATAADAAVISSYPPGWNRWKLRLPAGPVTVHDIAASSMFPEYISLCEVTGAGLKALAARAPASTILPDKRHPSYDPKAHLLASEIDPKKTYRVAMGYYGLPAYGVNYRKMPKTFFFNSPEEFLASGHTSLPVRNLRQALVTMAEAVARYVGKRGKLSPRKACFDLTQYLMNPQANEFGACDWLHLGVNVTWTDPRNARPMRHRYTLNLALAGEGDPATAPPRKNSKKFVEVDVAAGKPVRFDFASLDRKLPAVATAACRRFAIVAGKDGKTFKLASPDAAEGVIGRAVLMDVRLANKAKHALAGLTALAPTTMQRIHGSVWPDPRKKEGPKPYYTGYYQAVGPRRKPPVHENAALLVFDDGPARVSKLTANGVGYNFGLVAIYRRFTVPPGGAASIPLLLVGLDRPAKQPEVGLATVLDALKEAIAGKLPPAGAAPE